MQSKDQTSNFPPATDEFGNPIVPDYKKLEKVWDNVRMNQTELDSIKTQTKNIRTTLNQWSERNKIREEREQEIMNKIAQSDNRIDAIHGTMAEMNQTIAKLGDCFAQ